MQTFSMPILRTASLRISEFFSWIIYFSTLILFHLVKTNSLGTETPLRNHKAYSSLYSMAGPFSQCKILFFVFINFGF